MSNQAEDLKTLLDVVAEAAVGLVQNWTTSATATNSWGLSPALTTKRKQITALLPKTRRPLNQILAFSIFGDSTFLIRNSVKSCTSSAIACGHKDAIDLDRLRHDPLMKLAVGRCPESGQPLASQSTISRLVRSKRS
jgi:Transposase DDE domain group 1